MKNRRRTVTFPFLLLLAVAFASLSLLPEIGSARGESDFAIGAKMENFTLSDTEGKQRSFDELKGKNGTVIVFLSAQCPVVKAYNERIAQFAKDYAGKGVSVIGMNANSTESLEWVKSHAAEHYAFPVLIDKGNAIADKLGATVTPETYVFDKDSKLVYQGRIDNSREGDAITENSLRNAVDAMLAGKAVEKNKIPAFGCSIKRAAK